MPKEVMARAKARKAKAKAKARRRVKAKIEAETRADSLAGQEAPVLPQQELGKAIAISI